ncbi:MAG: homoserine dehydrogenase [Pirellulaceae bacterium]
MPDVQCGLIGCGTVGGGVVARWAEEVAGAALATVAVRSPRKRRDVDLSAVTVTGDAWDVVRDPRIGVLIDATGDCDAPRAWALEGFAHGKSFVTAGKALVARHGAELEERADAQGVGFRYEAAVAGALPVVALLRLGLSPGTVRAFEGVINGTCSFILSRLAEGVPFAAALEKARQAGLTEADSARDTSGRDAADKLAILARLCGVPIAADEVSIAGIEGLRPEDVAFGRARGWRLTLLATFRAVSGRATASVAPAFVAEDAFLAQARDEENAILLDGGPAGWVGLLGRGAGRAFPRRAWERDSPWFADTNHSHPGRGLLVPTLPQMSAA